MGRKIHFECDVTGCRIRRIVTDSRSLINNLPAGWSMGLVTKRGITVNGLRCPDCTEQMEKRKNLI